MPGIVANAGNFLINSDYPFDKVILTRSGSGTAVGSTTGGDVAVIPHGFSFIPLPMLSWSTDANFTVTYDNATGPIYTQPWPPPSFFDYWLYIEADATNIYVRYTNNNTLSFPVYYRIYCLEPSNVNVPIANTNLLVDSFILNSDYNYTKLYLAGTHTQPSGSNNVFINNDSGKITQVNAWKEQAGYISPIYTASAGFGLIAEEVSVSMTTLNLEIAYVSISSQVTTHYRIYLDE